MKEIELTQGRIALVDDNDFEYLNQFTWQLQPNRNTFYAVGYIDHKTVKMHRIIMSVPSDLQIDHIDHNGLNNQKNNLRICTRQQNSMNRIPNKSKYKGVYFRKDRNKWNVLISVDGILKNMGYYSSEIEAARTYDTFAKEYYGEYAYLNFK